MGSASKTYTPHWMIAVLLAFIAGSLWSRPSADPLLPEALAQTTPMAGARGVFAFAGQIDANRHGLFMLDIEQGTVWCYEIVNVDGVKKLSLVAGRTWIYDRYLRSYRCTSPTYGEIRDLLAAERDQPAATGAPPAPAGTDRPTP